MYRTGMWKRSRSRHSTVQQKIQDPGCAPPTLTSTVDEYCGSHPHTLTGALPNQKESLEDCVGLVFSGNRSFRVKQTCKSRQPAWVAAQVHRTPSGDTETQQIWMKRLFHCGKLGLNKGFSIQPPDG